MVWSFHLLPSIIYSRMYLISSAMFVVVNQYTKYIVPYYPIDSLKDTYLL